MVKGVFNKMVIIIAVSAAGIFAGNARFFRILRLYNDPVYQASDRKLYGEFDYNSNRRDVKALDGLDPICDGTSSYSLKTAHEAGARGQYLRGDSLMRRDFGFRATISGEYQCTSSVVSNALIGKSDIDKLVYYGEVFETVADGTLQKYFKLWNSRKWFYDFNASAQGDATIREEKRYSSHSLTDVSVSLEKTKTIIAAMRTELRPGIGWGKPVFVTPVYRAFEIERALLESGLINKELSDETMVAISHWLAREFSFTRTKDRPRKYFYAALDSIICKDSCFNKGSVTFSGSMNVEEKQTNMFPVLQDGLKVSVSGGGIVRAVYEDVRRTELGMWYPSQSVPGSYFELTYELVSLSLSWGKAISPNLFVRAGAYAGEWFSSNWGFDVSDNPLFHANAGCIYLVNDRISFDLSLEDFGILTTPLFKEPRRISLTGRYFVEEHVSIDLSLVHRLVEGWTRYNSTTYSSGRPFREIDNRIVIGASYEF